MESKTQKRKRLDSIDWKKEAKRALVTTSEFKAKIDYLKSHGGEQLTKRTSRCLFLANEYNYFIMSGHDLDYRLLYFQDANGFQVYSTNIFDESKNTRKKRQRAIVILHKKFRELTGLNENGALAKAFGRVNYHWKKCVPKQFYYMNPKFKCMESYDAKRWIICSEIDDSSHYPAAGCGLLPDALTQRVVAGRVAPTEEYPFAFYPATGHVAQYGEFDTHEWLKKPYATQLFDKKRWKSANSADTETILMKASKYELTETWKYFYERRKDDAEAKLVMNSAIGYMHRKDDKKYAEYPFAHIAAVIIARANEKHIRMVDKIGFKHVVQIVVDSIVYAGDKIMGATKSEKNLGVYVQEYAGAKGIFREILCKAIFGGIDKDFKKIVSSPFNVKSDGTPITQEYKDSLTPETISEMWQWQKRDII